MLIVVQLEEYWVICMYHIVPAKTHFLSHYNHHSSIHFDINVYIA